MGTDLEAAQLVGVEIEKAVDEAVTKLQNEANAELLTAYPAIQEKRLGSLDLLSL